MGNFGRALGMAVPRALGNITSMQNLRESEEQMGMQRDVLGMQKEKFEVEQATAKMDLAKQQEEAKYKAEWLDLDDAINEYAPTSTKSVREKFKKDVATLTQDMNGIPKIQRINVDRFIESKRKSREYGIDVLKTQGADYRERRSEIATLLSDPESKLKPEEIQTLQAENKGLIAKQKPIDDALAAESARKLFEEGKVTPESYGNYQKTGILSDLKQITEVKEYAPELKKFVKGKQVRDVDMNKPPEVAKARAEGFTEYEKPEAGEKEPKYTVPQKIDDLRQEYSLARDNIKAKYSIYNSAMGTYMIPKENRASYESELQVLNRKYNNEHKRISGKSAAFLEETEIPSPVPSPAGGKGKRPLSSFERK